MEESLNFFLMKVSSINCKIVRSSLSKSTKEFKTQKLLKSKSTEREKVIGVLLSELVSSSSVLLISLESTLCTSTLCNGSSTCSNLLYKTPYLLSNSKQGFSTSLTISPTLFMKTSVALSLKSTNYSSPSCSLQISNSERNSSASNSGDYSSQAQAQTLG